MLWLAGCARVDSSTPDAVPAHRPPLARPRRERPARRSWCPRGSPRSTRPSRTLEQQFDARLGVWAWGTGDTALVEYNADQRFAYCSTHKVFSAAAVLQRHTIPELDTIVHYTEADLAKVAPITSQHVATGMSLRDLCDAAVRYSDNTADNLLFAQIGGPAGMQAFLRSLGDTVSDSSRIEPDLNSAVPGDVRDTTTPQAWGGDLQRVVLGDVLSPDKRAILIDWMVTNLTGTNLIRAAAPAGWKVGDKTGNGSYGTRNDIAVLWPPTGDPLTMVVMSSRPQPDAAIDDHLTARAAQAVMTVAQP